MSTPNQTGHIGEIHRLGASPHLLEPVGAGSQQAKENGLHVACRTVCVMDHLAIPVRDQERSRRFYETYFALARGRRDGMTTAC